MEANQDELLRVEGLSTEFSTERGSFRAVDTVSFSLRPGETLGIVGESGCGKSVTSLSILNLLPHPYGKITAGRVWFRGQDVAQANATELAALRGRRIAMVFQEPMTALNPVRKIGKQITEVLDLHFPQLAAADKQTRAEGLLRRVGIPAPQQRLQEYPHQLSGGMRQRVMIAMALAGEPDLLIADEPTTALDVTIQAQILALLRSVQEERGMGLILITHDLGVVAGMCDRVVVMYAGQVVEEGSVEDIFLRPRHPYTRGLLTSMPSLAHERKSRLATIEGSVPALGQAAAACRFANRCAYTQKQCETSAPPLKGQAHTARCWRVDDLPPFVLQGGAGA